MGRKGFIALSFLLVGCTQGGGLPRPPGLLGVPRTSITSIGGANVTVINCQSVDPVSKVGDFYQGKFGSQTGWKSTYKKGAEMAQWSDGNIVALNVDSFKPKDPKKPGQMVSMFPGQNGGSYVILVTSQPGP